jgi:dihydrolipoamide dehydrogenase
MTEEEAVAEGLSVKVGMFPFKANARARCSEETHGFVKVVAEEATLRLVGMHIIGAHASELIHVGTFALEKWSTVSDLANMCFAHPTLSEAIKEACLAITKKPLHC